MAKKKPKKLTVKDKIKKIIPNLILLGVTVLILLIFLEISLRLVYPQSLSIVAWNDEFGKDFVANVENLKRYDTSNFIRGVYEYEISTNSDSFRDREYKVERNDKDRYIFLGDSMTFGQGVDIAYPDFIETKLLNNQTEILNFGYPGTGLNHHYKKLIHKGLKYNPDKVFIGITIGNDLESELDLNAKPQKSIIYNGAILSCFHNLHICPFFYSNFRKIKSIFVKPNFGEYNETLYNEKLEEFEKATLGFEELSKKENFELIFIIIPDYIQTDDEAYEKFSQFAGINSKLSIDRYGTNNDLVKIFETNNINYIDLTPTIRNETNDKSYYFIGEGHFNEHGTIRVSEIISESVYFE